MKELLEDLDLVLAPPPAGVRELYDRAAPQYDRFRALWLKLAGAPAEEALLDDLKATLRPGQRVLDAGCGTGALARQIRELEPQAVVTMLDLSPGMLELAADVPGTHVVGDVAALPFLDDYFDIVVSAWVIETVPDPMRAVSEYLRVLSSTGYLFYPFSSLPEGWLSRACSSALRAIVENRFA
ncbi:MAG: class I SAM-dependent methyltransferase, partial [Gaiellaceae bacterium]